MFDSIMTLIWMLICIIVVIGLAYFFTRYVAKSGWLGSLSGDKRGNIKILSQVTVGKDRQLLLVQMGERFFLLGNTASGITNLAEFTPEEAEKWQSDENDQGGTQPPSFRQALHTVLKQKVKR